MSYQALFGAFPIVSEGSSLDPKPNALVGELRGSSRNGAFFRGLRDLLNALPSHEALRFFADELTSPEQRRADGTVWTILDGKSALQIIATLDSLLRTSHEQSAVVADAEYFKDQGQTAEKIRSHLATAKECSDVNVETACGEDGDRPEFLFAALVGLRGLLRRAQAQSERIAIFTWSPN
jgi:hypothetical protein